MTKPFNLEAAKAGAPVQTKGGSPARIVCFDAGGPLPLVVLRKEDDRDMDTFGHEDAWMYDNNGRCNSGKGSFPCSNLDLVMA